MQACTDLHWRISSSRSSMFGVRPHEGARALCFAPRRWKSEGPGLLARAAHGRVRAPLCPQLAAMSSVACERHGGGRGDLSALQFSFRGCARQVRICRGCDRGNQYCAGGYAGERRRESVRRAGARHQLSYRGACRHAARQRRWRVCRAQKVTHQGSVPVYGTQ